MSNSLWPHGCNMPDFPLLHYLLEFAQTHIHWVSDAIQPSHPLSPLSPPAFNLSQHQGLFHESALRIRWPKYWSFSFSISPSNHYSGLISFRFDWFDLLAVQGTLKSLLQHQELSAPFCRAWPVATLAVYSECLFWACLPLPFGWSGVHLPTSYPAPPSPPESEVWGIRGELSRLPWALLSQGWALPLPQGVPPSLWWFYLPGRSYAPGRRSWRGPRSSRRTRRNCCGVGSRSWQSGKSTFWNESSTSSSTSYARRSPGSRSARASSGRAGWSLRMEIALASLLVGTRETWGRASQVRLV